MMIHLTKERYSILKEEFYQERPVLVANMWKYILREMRNPLIPISIYEELTGLKDVKEEERVQAIKGVMQNMFKLDPMRYNSLRFMMDFCRQVVRFQSENKMGSYNMAITFAPVIFRTKHLFKEDIMSVNTHYDVMIRMIENYNEIFSEDFKIEVQGIKTEIAKQKDTHKLGQVIGLDNMKPLPGQAS